MGTDQKSFDGEVSKIMIPSNESDFFFFFFLLCGKNKCLNAYLLVKQCSYSTYTQNGYLPVTSIVKNFV